MAWCRRGVRRQATESPKGVPCAHDRITRFEITARRLSLHLLLSQPAAVAQGMGDRLFIYGSDQLLEAPLPRGPLADPRSIEEPPISMAFGPDDALYVLRRRQIEPPFLGSRVSRVEADGTLTDVGEVDLFGGEDPIDLAFGPGNLLYVLTFGIALIAPPELFQRLLTLDPETLEVLESRFLPVSFDSTAIFKTLAPADDGLWLVTPEQLWKLDPADGSLDDAGLDLLGFGVPLSADVDSTGALWVLTEPGFVDPPIFFLKRLDPVTGALVEASFRPASSGTLAIHRRCRNDDNNRCLQGGRFSASVTWRDFADGDGPGRVAPGSSTDSTLFWFFDAANWELLVKVLDGCDNNGHFWVFSGATTDVEFDLTVIDLETGDEFSFHNPLGNPPLTANATTAFPACP